MKKYIIKHIKADFLKENSLYLNYDEKDGWKHFVTNSEQATRFIGKAKAKSILNKFNKPYNWEIVEVSR